MKEFSLKFNLGQTVYLVTDPEQNERLITGVTIRIRPSGISIVYDLSMGVNVSDHYEMEISEQRDIIKTTTA